MTDARQSALLPGRPPQKLAPEAVRRLIDWGGRGSPERHGFSMAWSYRDERRLLELAAQSKSPAEIANLMGRSPEAIHKLAIRLGISLGKTRRGPSTPTERLKAVRASASAGGRPKAKK